MVDDDASYRQALEAGLQQEGFTVSLATNGREALRVAREVRLDAVLLDLRLPDISGIEVCRELRKWSDVPILMLSAVADELDIVLCFELGADDYIPKPFRRRELVARVEAAIRHRDRARRAQSVEPEMRELVVGPLTVDFVARIVELDGKRVELAKREFDLLAYLATKPNRVVSREELMEAVWGIELRDDRTIDTHMYRLRSKIEADSTHPELIVTVRGVGFLLRDQAEPDRRSPGGREPVAAQPKRPLT